MRDGGHQTRDALARVASSTGRGRMQGEDRADHGLDRHVTGCAKGGKDEACALPPILLLQNSIGLSIPNKWRNFYLLD